MKSTNKNLLGVGSLVLGFLIWHDFPVLAVGSSTLIYWEKLNHFRTYEKKN